jgi:hypothetical protein
MLKKVLFSRAILGVAALSLACMSVAGGAAAQDNSKQGPKPKFVTLPSHFVEGIPEPATKITNWTGSFKSGTKTFSFSMIGTNPATTNTTTTINVYIIPIKVTCRGTTEDPMTIQSNGQTALTNTTASPIFTSSIDYVQGGTDLGTTQYEDAFQRGNFWTNVLTNPSYHVLLTPVVLSEQTLSVPTRDCSIGNPFGFGNVPIVSINYFDTQLQAFILAQHSVTPSAFVIGMTYNMYLSDNSGLSGCCIGGYHSDFGSSSAPQTYGHYTYIPNSGQFSQDVSALSHEVGEWIDDPFVNNATEVSGGCTGILEVGDPLESGANFGDYAYSLGGFTYHLQDLCFLDYWSGTTTLEVNGWYTFQNEKHSKCS